MSIILPINIKDLLYCRGVESARVEFKASWDEKTTGSQVLKTICAFANDLQNLNGGYIVIGVAEKNGYAEFPPKGISPDEIDKIQRWIRGKCNRINPEYYPIFSPEIIDKKHIIVIWVQRSEGRPHSFHEDRGQKYYVRIGSETVAAKNEILKQLFDLTTHSPFDDRKAQDASIDDIREAKVREFLRDIDSGLLDETDKNHIFRKLRLSVPQNGYDIPLNIGLLLFSDEPQKWFRGARIVIAEFSADASGDIIEEKIFPGGIIEQLRGALSYLESYSSKFIEKRSDSFQVRGWVSYPIVALREALVNAVYHRSYESSSPDPIRVKLFPDKIEIISYPGPVRGINKEHLQSNKKIPPVPARNSRIGEFLKLLKLAEEYGTGIMKLYKAMNDNGSNEPIFDFDEAERSYFLVTLPAHPEYIALSALRDAAYLKALGREVDAFNRIKGAYETMPKSPSLTTELIRLYGKNDNIEAAKDIFYEFEKKSSKNSLPLVLNVLIETLINASRESDARRFMEMVPKYIDGINAIDTAILYRRLKNQEKAHRYFEKAGSHLLSDVRAMHEFAQTKMTFARNAYLNKNRESNRRFLKEAKDLLERVTQMNADRARHAWAWRDLAKVKIYLKEPNSEIERAYSNAIELLPDEIIFKQELNKWLNIKK